MRNDPADRARWLTFVVVGAGPTGVELAGQIAELSRRTLRTDFRSIDPSECRVVLVEAGSAAAPTFSAPVSRAAAAHLDQIGVGVYLGATVRSIDDDAVGISVSRPGGEPAGDSDRVQDRALDRWGDRVAARTAPVPANRFAAHPGRPDLGGAQDPRRLTRKSSSWAHMAALDDPCRGSLRLRSRRADTRPAPSAGVSMAVPAANGSGISTRGMLVTISRFFAVADIGPVRLSGFLAWVLWRLFTSSTSSASRIA